MKVGLRVIFMLACLWVVTESGVTVRPQESEKGNSSVRPPKHENGNNSVLQPPDEGQKVEEQRHAKDASNAKNARNAKNASNVKNASNANKARSQSSLRVRSPGPAAKGMGGYVTGYRPDGNYNLAGDGVGFGFKPRYDGFKTSCCDSYSSVNPNLRPPCCESFTGNVDKFVQPPIDDSVLSISNTYTRPLNDSFIRPLNDSFIRPLNNSFIRPLNDSYIPPICTTCNGQGPLRNALFPPLNDTFISPGGDYFDRNNSFRQPGDGFYRPPSGGLLGTLGGYRPPGDGFFKPPQNLPPFDRDDIGYDPQRRQTCPCTSWFTCCKGHQDNEKIPVCQPPAPVCHGLFKSPFCKWSQYYTPLWVCKNTFTGKMRVPSARDYQNGGQEPNDKGNGRGKKQLGSEVNSKKNQKENIARSGHKTHQERITMNNNKEKNNDNDYEKNTKANRDKNLEQNHSTNRHNDQEQNNRLKTKQNSEEKEKEPAHSKNHPEETADLEKMIIPKTTSPKS